MPTIRKKGTVQAYNVSPKGSYEGLLLEQKDETMQVNFPQELASTLAEAAPLGEAVQVQVQPGDRKKHPVHPVFELVSLTNSAGQKIAVTQAEPSGSRFAGTVVRLNYSLHGEVNGGILDNGNFLHLKPHGAAAVGIQPGMHVKGKGKTKPMTGNHVVIEADEVNGVRIEKPKKKPAKKKKPH